MELSGRCESEVGIIIDGYSFFILTRLLLQLYIDVDNAMVTARDPTDAENMPNTIAYVDALITAVSAIYEKEIDTHREYFIWLKFFVVHMMWSLTAHMMCSFMCTFIL